MLTLYLLRHGESEDNVRRVISTRTGDPCLSSLGVQQATQQADKLCQIPFRAIYSSPLRRACQTAEIVGQRCGLTPIREAALLEVAAGALDGASLIDAEKLSMFDRVINSWETRHSEVPFPGGESLDDIAQRTFPFVERLARLPGPVLLVAHSMLFSAVIWLYCSERLGGFMAAHMSRGHYSVLQHLPGSARPIFRLAFFNVGPADPLALCSDKPG